MGVLTDEDVEKLLIMIDPETWDPTFEKGKKIFLSLKNKDFYHHKIFHMFS